MFKLDFTLNTSKERFNYIKESIDLNSLTPKGIEICTDYILYGKDEDGTSMVDRKEVFIRTKYSSYSKQEPLSLEMLMESPTFDEAQLQPLNIKYKKPKQSIDREKFQNFPGFKELWEQIDNLNHIIRFNEGKDQKVGGEKISKLSSKQLYHLKHQLVELRQEQYALKDSFITPIQPHKNFISHYSNPADYQLNYPVFPCGLMSQKDDLDFYTPFKARRPFTSINIEEEINRLSQDHKPFLNLLDKTHLKQLYLAYYEIKDIADRQPESALNNLIWTLDFYSGRAGLTSQQILIFEDKKRQLSNKEICAHLMDEMGIYHKENYISTIWDRILGMIAAAVERNYDEWISKDYAAAWKTCSCCGRTLLRDPFNFVRKAKAPDGLTNRCKACDQKKRDQKKGGQINGKKID